ncbi:hypothetical protein EBR43_12310 [bacterium]|nr:hypothetical protein [bacterium]
MFESIKSALSKNTATNRNKDILKLEVGNTYTVRLLPNTKNPEKTFHHYYTFGWTSFCTGSYVSAVSPMTYGARDPINELRYRLLRGTDEEKKKASSIIRTEKWLVNAYVVNDPVNQDNNGKIMVLRYGKQLHKIIMDAIEGEGSEDFGPRIFDLSDKGCSLKVKVEQQGDYPTYVSSKFAMPKAIEGLTPSKIEELYNNIIDLDTVFTVKSYDELKQLLDEHFYCSSEGSVAEKKQAPGKSTKQEQSNQTEPEELLEDDTVKKLLEGLDDNESA